MNILLLFLALLSVTAVSLPHHHHTKASSKEVTETPAESRRRRMHKRKMVCKNDGPRGCQN